MAQVDDAHARGDLLALLELQLRIEHIDAEHVKAADETRLKHYNKVLAEQLDDLRLELEVVETEFEMEYGIDADVRPRPAQLGQLLLQQELLQQQELLRGAIATLEQDRRMFAHPRQLRSWLKARRRELDEDFFVPF